MKSVGALLLALLFFAGGAFLFVSTGYRDNFTTTSATGPAKVSPEAPRTRGFSRSDRRAARRNWRKTVAPETGIVAQVGQFLNNNLNLRALNLSIVDGISLIFGMMGTFFTWRSYRIQKQTAERQRVAMRS